MSGREVKLIAYLRVSTARQGRSGLGLEAQREAVQNFRATRHGKIVTEYVEVESGKRNDRPELMKALRRCRTMGATLVVAKLDRLNRNAAFLLTLRDSGVDFVAADLPKANSLTVGILACVAQFEREAIGQRTKAALAAAKARGKQLGGNRAGGARIRDYQHLGVDAAQKKADQQAELRREPIEALMREGLSLTGIAKRLNSQGEMSCRSGQWTATAVKRVIQRFQ